MAKKTSKPNIWLPLVATVLLVAFLAFVTGAIFSEFQIFPYPQLFGNAFDYAHSLLERRSMEQEAADQVEAAKTFKPVVTIAATSEAFDGYTFLTFDVARPSTARLIDMKGNVLHEWHKPFLEIWPTHPQCPTPSPESAIAWRYAKLFPNGDIIVSVISYGDTPYGYGLAKLDKNSNVIWAVADNFHHEFSFGPDGTLYGLTHHWRDLKADPIHGVHLPKRVLEDFAVEVSPDGKETSSVSILDALSKHGSRELVDSAFINDHQAKTWDPLHANDIEYITTEFASHHPWMKPGMTLISLRELDALVLLDLKSKRIVWSVRGPWERQHDPDLLGNGNILLFDNRGSNVKDSGSRVIEFTPESGRIAWSYAGTLQQPFRSDKSGGQDRLPNGNTLISEDDNGRVFEVSPAGNIVWEYHDVHLHHATRVTKDYLTFVPSALVGAAATKAPVK